MTLIFLFLFLIPPMDAKTPEFIWSDAIWQLKRFPSYSSFFKELSEKGYTGTDIEIIEPNGNFYFYSPTLAKLNWTQGPDLLSDLVREWEGYNHQSRKVPISLHLNFSTLARYIQEKLAKFPRHTKKPAPKETGMVSLDLQENYKFSDLTSEPFPFEFQNILSAAIPPPIKKLNLLTTHPEFETFLSLAALNGKLTEVLPGRFFVREQALYPTTQTEILPSVGLSEIVASLAQEHQKEFYYGVDSRLSPNLLLYRTFLHPIDGYLFFSDLETTPSQSLPDIRDLRKTLLEVSQLKTASKKKPVANLVLSAHASELQLAQFIEPIVNALLANGYELKITFGEIAKGADLYYITNSNEWLKNLAFFEELLTLLDYRKSRFYGTVILHPTGELLTAGRWKKIRQHFKIPESEKGWVADLPSEVVIKGKKIPWRGNVSGGRKGMSFLRESQVRILGGEVLLSEVFQNETFALILRSGNHFLVNGNALHLQASAFLSNLIGGRLLSPVNAYVSSNSHGIAALSLEETALTLQLPFFQVDQKWKVLRYINGKKISEETIQHSDFFETQLKPFELLLLVPLLQ